MNIAVLTVGDELLNGDQPDTNTAAIARVLGSRGYPLRESLTVGDAEADRMLTRDYRKPYVVPDNV